MPDYPPFEVVLDYQDDKVVIDGTELPCRLSNIAARAVTEDNRATVTLTLEVDQVRSIARMPEPSGVEVDAPPAPTAEQTFEDRLDQVRTNARRR